MNLLIGLDGKYIFSGFFGVFIRGRLDVLLIGWNFYFVDICVIFIEIVWRIG